MIKVVKNFLATTIFIIIFLFTSPVYAIVKQNGNLELIFNEPLFPAATQWYPGLSQTVSFQIKNHNHKTATAQIETFNETTSKQLADILKIQIKQENSSVYGSSSSKTLQNFFDDDTITLGDIPPGDVGKIFDLTITMPSSTSNQYQESTTSFDLRIRFPSDSSSATATGSTPTPTPTAATLGEFSAFFNQILPVLGEQISASAPAAPGSATPTPPGFPGNVAGTDTSTSQFNFNWLLALILLILVYLITKTYQKRQ